MGLTTSAAITHDKGDIIVRAGAATVALNKDSDALALKGSAVADTSTNYTTRLNRILYALRSHRLEGHKAL